MKGAARLVARVVPGQEAAGAKFSDYFDHSEAWAGVPSHRTLAMLRGRNEGALSLDLSVDEDAPRGESPSERTCAAALGAGGAGAGDRWLREAAAWAWRTKLRGSLSLDLMVELRERAEEDAIRVFARNLRDLLLAAPAGGKATLGIDPGIRTGCKLAVVDATGKVLATDTVYPFQPRNDLRGAQATMARLIGAHGVRLIAIGNGTASRETEKLVLRGAVSIARRLQDPLAELVKIEPRSIGVGQYQHDVDQGRLLRSLEGVVEDAVNAVGVDLNTASAPLLARVSGLGTSLAGAIVAHRDAHGPFRTRRELLKVARLGPKAFEQAAGFLRIPNGAEPLDASAVHPEAYDLARRIVKACGRDLRSLMGDGAALRQVDPRAFAREARPRPAPVVPHRELRGRRERDWGPAARDAAGGHGDQRGGLWRLRGRGRAPGRAGACEPARGPLREGPARGGQGGGRGAGPRGRGGRGAQAHRADHEEGQRRGARAGPRARARPGDGRAARADGRVAQGRGAGRRVRGCASRQVRALSGPQGA
jgi:uncharacterized protein